MSTETLVMTRLGRHLQLNAKSRLFIAMGLGCAVACAAAGLPGPARADGSGKVTAVTSTVLSRFDATQLVPAGPLNAVASIVTFPAGFTLTHHHGGLRFIYVLSGTTEVTDTAGMKTYGPGDFWYEPPGHSHTAHAVTDTKYYVLDLLQPGAAATVPESAASGPSNTTRTILGTFDVTGLFPSGPINGTATVITFPTGYMLKHYHGGPRFIYQLSGTLQLNEDSGLVTHKAGDFFLEARGHVHTANTIEQASFLVLDFLSPGTKATYPLVGALPAVARSGSGQSGSFTTTFSSVLPGQGVVLFGTGPGCEGLVQIALSDSGSGSVSHSVKVRGNDLPGTVGDIGIVPGSTYWFEAVTASQAGVEVDNNDGKCYSVTVPTS
jgi:quercetin dioxygenase-like cupin family protein